MTRLYIQMIADQRDRALWRWRASYCNDPVADAEVKSCLAKLRQLSELRNMNQLMEERHAPTCR